MDTGERTRFQRVRSGEIKSVVDTLVVETDVAIELDGELLLRATCSPGQLREWVIGHLFSEGLIARSADVKEIREAAGVFSVELAASAPSTPVPLAPVASDCRMTVERILAVARETGEKAELFQQTGGTHAMAIADEAEIIAFVEDISRTCALEKALGIALLQRFAFSRSLAFLSSRVPSRMIAKLVRCRIPIASAISAPTADAVRLAERTRLCLCGFVRGEGLNVYTHGWRIGR